MPTSGFPVRFASVISCVSISMVCALYFSSLNRIFMGTTVDFLTGFGLCSGGRKDLRPLSAWNSFTKKCMTKWTALFLRAAASAALGRMSLMVRSFASREGVLSFQLSLRLVGFELILLAWQSSSALSNAYLKFSLIVINKVKR